MNDKYVVFKADDWNGMVEHAPKLREWGENYALDDAVVIREQDLLAAPMFGLYRDMITLIIKAHSQPVDIPALMRLADTFDTFAAEATDQGFKLPD